MASLYKAKKLLFEIIWHCINIHIEIFFSLYCGNNLWQAFALKYSAKAFLTEIFFQGVPNKVEKLQKFQGGGGGYDKHPVKWKFQWGEGLKQKCPPWGRRGGRYGCFLELHNISFIDTVDQPLKAPTIASDTTAEDERDVNKLTTKFGSSLTSEGKNLNF